MKCRNCGGKTIVTDSRASGDYGEIVRRRHECLNCKIRFTTYEISDVRMAQFQMAEREREKLANGIKKVYEMLKSNC